MSTNAESEWAEQVRAMRRSYGEEGLPDGALPADPIEGIRTWLTQAAAQPLIVEPNAMVLSTVGADGAPHARTVLLKGIDSRGLTFFTNYGSRKGRDLEHQALATCLFPWYAMERQLTVTGTVERLPREESEEYFASRPWGHQIGALASDQSRPLASREELQDRWEEAAKRYPDNVPMPSWWGGYLIKPERVEFWQGRYSRLHDRVVFESTGSGWSTHRLYP